MSNLLCQQNGAVGGILPLVEAFDLIEFFAVASLFGWLTFSVVTDDIVKRIHGERRENAPEEKEKTVLRKEKTILRKKLNTINDYFIISFAFYAISAFADYCFHHKNLFDQTYTFAVITVLMFGFGTFTLALPVFYVWYLERRGDIFVQRVDYALASFIFTAFSIALLFSVTVGNDLARMLAFPLSFIPFFALILTLIANPLTRRRVVLVFLLTVMPLLILMVLRMWGTPSWPIS